MLCLYWNIGRGILKKQEEEGWGTKIIDRMAKDLKDAFPEMSGFSPRNIKYMRKFADSCPDFEIVQRVVAQIPWRTNISLMDKLKDEESRIWYAYKVIENGWSKTILDLQIESRLMSVLVALKDYSSMEFIIANTSSEIKNARDKMSAVRSPQYDEMPRTHNPQAGEERILNGIEEIDILQERYRQAVEYMDWFKPVWEQLTADERYVLETFYDEECSQTGAMYEICDHFSIERSSAYNKKNRALAKLAVLLYGK